MLPKFGNTSNTQTIHINNDNHRDNDNQHNNSFTSVGRDAAQSHACARRVKPYFMYGYYHHFNKQTQTSIQLQFQTTYVSKIRKHYTNIITQTAQTTYVSSKHRHQRSFQLAPQIHLRPNRKRRSKKIGVRATEDLKCRGWTFFVHRLIP